MPPVACSYWVVDGYYMMAVVVVVFTFGSYGLFTCRWYLLWVYCGWYLHCGGVFTVIINFRGRFGPRDNGHYRRQSCARQSPRVGPS